MLSYAAYQKEVFVMSKSQQASRRAARQAQKASEKAAKMRCFLGLPCPLHAQLKPVYELLEPLRTNDGKPPRLAPPEHLHVTVKFLGTVQVDQLGNIEQLAQQVISKHTLPTLRCTGIGVFKNSAWVGIEQEPALTALVEELNTAFGLLGFSIEDKAFVPHVTIARFPPPLKDSVTQVLQTFEAQEWGEFAAPHVSLYRSDTLPHGATYSVLSELKPGESHEDGVTSSSASNPVDSE